MQTITYINDNLSAPMATLISSLMFCAVYAILWVCTFRKKD